MTLLGLMMPIENSHLAQSNPAPRVFLWTTGPQGHVVSTMGVVGPGETDLSKHPCEAGLLSFER